MTAALYLFATIGGTKVAVATADIEAVVRLPEIVPVTQVPDHVCGLAALRSRVLTVIDMRQRILGQRTPSPGAPVAVVLEHAGHGYGLLVDEVHDICTPDGPEQAIRGRLDPAWRPFAHGLIQQGGRSHLLLNLADFIVAAGHAQAA